MGAVMAGREAISKEALRAEAISRRDGISLDLRTAFSRAASERAMDSLGGVSVVAIYSALGSEIDPAHLVSLLRQSGATCVFPRVMAPDSPLEFCAISQTETLKLGHFGVLEPPHTLPAIDIGSIGAFVVPALCFDTAGNRLGWGKGYYDRTLAQNSQALRLGFCFHQQIQSSVPHTPSDQSMDCIVSESETLQAPRSNR